jgi:hypothetical protein
MTTSKNEGILIPAQIEAVQTRRDRSLKITLGTQELEPQKAGQLMGLNQHVATVYITSRETLSADEKDILDSIEPDLPGKSPSQRLRAVLYLLWKQEPAGFQDQNLHYLHHMEKILEHFKAKLKD